jgi:hypothetical protein
MAEVDIGGVFQMLGTMMAEMREMRRQMATKDDLKNLATKDDLEKLATKDDLAEVKAAITEYCRSSAMASSSAIWTSDCGALNGT